MPSYPVNFETVLCRLGNNQELFHELIQFYFEDCPRLVDDLREGVAKEDSKTIEYAAHRLKGLVSNFDMPLPLDCAALLEQMGKSKDFSGAVKELPKLEKSLVQLEELLSPFRNSGDKIQ
jgi:HPt (histidine-containing phosphotransfer) domain-containing protein